ncbi:MAG: Ppx/GppA family phosphatase [Actinobacteria bacterium]|nr:Ppx/GppA family phosphatase [Thermoleophilia bacterium]MCB9011827.1 Ppx/GppA family phosphatase [Actinomycetota bacterium]
MSPDAPTHEPGRDARATAIIDMGSNSFRLVVYHWMPGGWFRLVDEIREAVRLSEGQTDGRLQPRALARAAHAADLYAAYCDAAGIDHIDAVATSAVRDATNQDEALDALSAGGRLPVRVLSEDDESRYGYLAAVNGSTVADGWFLDIGGGSLQVGRIERRHLTNSMSAALGAVRLTEAFLTGDQQSGKEAAALRKHVRKQLTTHDWIGGGGRMVGIGGAIRTLAVMEQRRAEAPFINPDGHRMTRDALGETIDLLTSLPVAERRGLQGLRSDRADIILAAALAIDEAMATAGCERLEVTAQGLREGVFFEHYLRDEVPPLLPDVRRTSVLNAGLQFEFDRRHAEQVARVALAAFDETARLGLHRGDSMEREVLWTAAMLHDVGVLVDYSAHHRHSEYLVLNTGLPGYDHHELAMIACMLRGHRKGVPSLKKVYGSLVREDDDARYLRGVALLRLSEQLERAKAGQIRELRCRLEDDELVITVGCEGDPSLPLWSGMAERQHVERAFGVTMRLESASGIEVPERPS